MAFSLFCFICLTNNCCLELELSAKFPTASPATTPPAAIPAVVVAATPAAPADFGSFTEEHKASVCLNKTVPGPKQKVHRWLHHKLHFERMQQSILQQPLLLKILTRVVQ